MKTKQEEYKANNRLYWRIIAVGLLACTLLLLSAILKIKGFDYLLNLFAMYGALIASKEIVQAITKKRFR